SLKGTVFGGARAGSTNVSPPGRRFPQGLKPAFLQTEDGTAEAVPYPKPSHEGSARQIHHYYKIASTNSEAMRCAAEGAPEGSVFLAEEQLAGRGRGAHSWHSARSAGIYCSVILRPAM